MKVEKSQVWLQLFEIAREQFWTIDGGTQNFTCSQERLETSTQNLHAQEGWRAATK